MGGSSYRARYLCFKIKIIYSHIVPILYITYTFKSDISHGDCACCILHVVRIIVGPLHHNYFPDLCLGKGVLGKNSFVQKD